MFVVTCQALSVPASTRPRDVDRRVASGQSLATGYRRWMARKSPLERFVRFSAKEPPMWQKATTVVLAVAMPVSIGIKRGWPLGLAAGVVYGCGFLGMLFARHRFIAWSTRHPVADAMFVIPLMFFALAYVTNLSLWVCATIAVCTWIALAGLAVWRRRTRRVTF
jgi:hypothetical protein